MTVTNFIAQLVTGYLSGLAVGAAVFSHAFSRAVVMGLIAGGIIGAIMVDGVTGYVRWATYLPTELGSLTPFSIAFVAGIVSGARFWSSGGIL